MKKLILISLFAINFSEPATAGWFDFMKTATSKVGSAIGGAAKSVGTAAVGGAKCNMMRNQGMMNTPQYYQECVQTGLAPSPMGMGMQTGLPYGVTPATGSSGMPQVTLNDQWTDDPLAGAGAQFPQQGMMGGGMMGQPGMMGGGMYGGGMYGGQQPTSFSGMLGRSLANNLMGGNRGASPGGYGAQPGYGGRPY